jgi:DNA-binding transcriptional MocR family regulator
MPSQNEDIYIYQYATTCGTQDFRRAIAAFMNRRLGIEVDIKNLCPSFGNSGALSTIARTLAKPGDLVIVEEFTYYLAGQVFSIPYRLIGD